MKNRVSTAIEITNLLKENGYDVSKSYGRNAGSTFVDSSKGINVSKNKKLATYGNEVIQYFKVTCTKVSDREIAEILKKENYIVLRFGFGEVLLAGKKIR